MAPDNSQKLGTPRVEINASTSGISITGLSDFSNTADLRRQQREEQERQDIAVENALDEIERYANGEEVNFVAASLMVDFFRTKEALDHTPDTLPEHATLIEQNLSLFRQFTSQYGANYTQVMDTYIQAQITRSNNTL